MTVLLKNNKHANLEQVVVVMLEAFPDGGYFVVAARWQYLLLQKYHRDKKPLSTYFNIM